MITIIKYKRISDLINDIQVRGTDIVYYVDKMAVNIALSDIPSQDVNRLRLESQITTTSDLLTNTDLFYTRQMKIFVGALQRYVNDNYSSVNDFLSDNNTKVGRTFALISDVVGFTIDSSNIEGYEEPSA